MSESAGGLLSHAGKYVAMAADDAVLIGQRLRNSQDDSNPPKRRRLNPSANPASGQILKQEINMTNVAQSPEDVQAAMDAELTKLLDGRVSPEEKAQMLIKMTIYRQDVERMAPTLRVIDPDLAEEAISQWIDEGDGLLKQAVFNSFAGSEEIVLRKAADEKPGDVELAEYLLKLPDDVTRNKQLIKISQYRAQYESILGNLAKMSPDERFQSLEEWYQGDNGSDASLKRAVVKSYDAHMIYGDGMAPENPVREIMGNASTYAGKAIPGSDGSPDQGGRRMLPKVPTGEGEGRQAMGASGGVPMGGRSSSTDVSSGPNDAPNGGGNTKPKARIRRKGATGGLGSDNDPWESKPSLVGNQDDYDAAMRGRDRRMMTHMDGGGMSANEDAWKSEALGVLVENMDEDWLDVMSKLEPEDRVAVMEAALVHTADLVAWSENSNPDALQKSTLDSAVSEWLTSDPDSVGLKQFVAEALATAGEIPLSLGKAIMGYTPPAERFRLRRHAA